MYSYISFIAKYNKDNYSFKKELEILEQKNKDNNTKTLLFVTHQFNIVGIIIGISKQNISYLLNNIFSDFDIHLKSKIEILEIDVANDLIPLTLLLENLEDDFCTYKNVIVDSLIRSMLKTIEINDILCNTPTNSHPNSNNNQELHSDIDINFLKIKNRLQMIEEKSSKAYAKIFEGNGNSILSKLAKLEEQQLADDRDITELKIIFKDTIGNSEFNLLNLFLKSDKKQLFTLLFILIAIISICQTYLLPKISMIVEEATKEILK
jgi:hypothetical protein